MTKLIEEVRKEKKKEQKKEQKEIVKGKIKEIIDRIEELRNKERKIKERLDKVRETWVKLEGLVGDLEDNHEFEEIYQKIKDGEIDENISKIDENNKELNFSLDYRTSDNPLYYTTSGSNLNIESKD